jgi:hypothetical protein
LKEEINISEEFFFPIGKLFESIRKYKDNKEINKLDTPVVDEKVIGIPLTKSLQFILSG